MARQIQVDGKLEVKKADVIVKARYKLNPLALKFITTLIAGLKRGDDINEEYVFRVKDFKELTGLKRKDIYSAVKEALKELLEKPLFIPEEDGFLMCNWVSGGHYIENAGEVRFMIYPKLRPYLLEAQKKFLKYRLENILSLRSSYSIRMYEILKDWLEMHTRYGNKAEKIISLDELKNILEIPKSYQYGNSSGIKNRILKKAQQELKKNTDIVFEYEEIKTGRKITHLKFIIQENPAKKQKEPLSAPIFKSRRSFVAFLRANYSGNGKFFGWSSIDGKHYWLGLDKQGFVYGFEEEEYEIRNFNAIESASLYDHWLQIAQKSSTYQQILQEGKCVRNIFLEEKELWHQLHDEIFELETV